jgi:folate-binding protein YgfZ
MQAVTQQEPANTGLDDSRRKLIALTAGCGINRPDRALLSLTGQDRIRWLNGRVSNNIRDLAVGRGVYAFILTPQGHIQADLYAFNRGESLLLEADQAQAETILTIFRKYIIMDKVEIEDVTSKLAVFSLAGPKCRDVLAALGYKSELAQLQFVEANLGGVEITIVRGDNPCFLNYDLWVEAGNADQLWQELLRAGAEEVHDEAIEKFRILCGIPKIGQDIREKTLPQETGQERALNFTKGCYIGQEIVERIRARGAVHRTFTGFEVEGSAPSPGTKIQSEGKDVGEITSVLPALVQNRQLALGYLRKEFAGGDKELRAGEARVKPVALPFRNLLARADI